MRYLTASLLSVSILSTPVAASDLRILVSGIETDEGEISCSLFDAGSGFPQKSERAARSVQYAAVAPMLTCTFDDVEPGRYAVAVVHDRNGNKQVDTSFGGSIKEPWGVTNNVRPAQRAPKFVEAMISVSPTRADYEVVVQR